MPKKNIGKPNETGPHRGTTPRRVVDPAEKYYEQSRKDREAYKKALKHEDQGVSWSDDYLAERNHPVLHQEGNSQSRSGFDFRTFRSKI